MVKNPPANVGDIGSVPGPGAIWACALEPGSTTREATAWEVHTLQLEWPLLTATREKPAQQWRPSTAKNNSIKLLFLKGAAFSSMHFGFTWVCPGFYYGSFWGRNY